MENKGSVTSSMKREIACLSSITAGCRYCEAHETRAAERYGSSQERLENIWEYKSHEAFSELDRAMFDLAIVASQFPNGVSKEIKARAEKFFNEGEIIKILGVVALFGYLNSWNDSVGTELENPAEKSAEKILGTNEWEAVKHFC